MAGRLRAHTEFQNNALTLPDYFTSRFSDKKRILRLLSAIVILVFFAIYCASGMVAGARLFESLFGWDYTTALWPRCSGHDSVCVLAAFWRSAGLILSRQA